MRKLYYDGRVVSMDNHQEYSAIGIEGEKITFVGSSEDALAMDWDEKESLNGKLVVPSFTDTHMHALCYAMLGRELNLYGTSSAAEVISRGREKLKKTCSYIFGMGWNENNFNPQVPLKKEDADAISTDVPVILLRACGHIAIVNSKSLEMIRQMKDLPEDVIANVDFKTGQLKESAMRLYMELIPKRDAKYIHDLFTTVQKELNACGISGIHSDDFSSIPGAKWRDIVSALTAMDDAGEMTVRVHEQCLILDDGGEFEAFANETKAMRESKRNYFELGPRKLLQDGSLGARSACMINGYEGCPDQHGIPTYNAQELYDRIKQADDAGMDVAVHAIGDLAARDVLDALEKVIRESTRKSHRHGVVHVQFITDEDIQRMADLGIQAYIQPIFLNSDIPMIPERIRPEDQREGYSWKTLQDKGILTSGGSDCPVEYFDPLKNIYAAVVRKSLSGSEAFRPEECLSVYDAVALFTSSAAKAAGHEDDRGILKAGYLADFVVLDQDIFTIDPEAIKDTSVLKTVVGGKEVYTA